MAPENLAILIIGGLGALLLVIGIAIAAVPKQDPSLYKDDSRAGDIFLPNRFFNCIMNYLLSCRKKAGLSVKTDF